MSAADVRGRGVRRHLHHTELRGAACGRALQAVGEGEGVGRVTQEEGLTKGYSRLR